jgi:class 3 adenylate cyclase
VDDDGDGRGALTAAGLSCGVCGIQLGATAKFCSDCGTPVTSATQSAEYKQVTVLFADVVHSMDIAAAVGPERLREIMTKLVNAATAVVKRYGGTVDKFTGDGIMAVFGAPVALEDHAFRACLSALDIQTETQRLAAEVERRDGVALQLRVGLNSGEVIAGEIGLGPMGYTAIGEQVGMAQRMESVAPPGGVMLSASTARLAENAVVLSEPQLARIKGSDEPVPACRLLRIAPRDGLAPRVESRLIGRRWEMAAVAAILDRSINGNGGVVGLVGPPGIGKSRVLREAAGAAAARGVDVFWTFCESHTSEIPFHVVTRLLRAASGVDELDDLAARSRVRAQVPGADEQDLVLLDDLLGIGDPDIPLSSIDPDARRRRLTAMINTAFLARAEPAVYIVEDAHWIDEVSESMLAELVAVIPHTPSMMFVTYRPEYGGALARVAGAQTIALGPLTDSESSELTAVLLGEDPSLRAVAATIMARAGGNPFFTEEIVRDLIERGVLRGERGAYVCQTDVTEVKVPATLQATIAARIDRLGSAAKRALGAAAVIGLRFDTDLLSGLAVEPVVDELVAAELIDQVSFTPPLEFAFRHPLMRTVAYESQLKSDRVELHRCLAATVEQRDPGSADENAALIAEHLEAAGDVHGAYAWHMRAGAWSTNRDVAAARSSWERARQMADRLPADDPNRIAMRIAARTLLCGSAWRVHENISGTRFEELRELCTTAGDKASLVISMAGLVVEHAMHARVREASLLASEYMALLESIGDPTLTVGLSFAAIAARCENGEPVDMLRWSQNVVDLAGGDATKGNFIIGSPLAAALAWRGLARWWLGRPGWRKDLDQAVAMARSTDPMTHALVITYKYSPAIPLGVLLADDTALRDIEEAVQIAERIGDDVALASARLALGLALSHRDSPDRERGLELLAQVREMALNDRFSLTEIPIVDVYTAQERAKHGDRDGAVRLVGAVLDDLFNARQTWVIPATDILVELLLARGAENDVHEAEAAVDRLAVMRTDDVWAARDIMVLRLRALLAQARGDQVDYRDLVDRYRAVASTLGFEGHMKWAEAMP